jgi:hypothetical protein
MPVHIIRGHTAKAAVFDQEFEREWSVKSKHCGIGRHKNNIVKCCSLFGTKKIKLCNSKQERQCSEGVQKLFMA